VFSRQRFAAIFLIVAFAFCVHAQTRSKVTPETSSPSSKSASTPSNVESDSIEFKVEQFLRQTYAWGPEFEVKVGPTKPSVIQDLLEVPVTITMAGQSDLAVVYVSKDGKFMIRGELADMSKDPLAETRSKLDPGDSPSIGPKNAKVTLIEYADFECPSCRQLDLILRDLLKAQPDVRLIFKNFPLTDIHPWAMTAAEAGQCAYQQNPAAFWKLHDAIFDAQDLISPSNVWDKMIDLATQQGLNISTYKTCIADQNTANKVEKTQAEGKTLNITGTPTTFVNGRRVVGADSTLLNQYLTYEKANN
jgi:protein-disulfide isomerase